MTAYAFWKYLHVVTVVTSGSLFVLRHGLRTLFPLRVLPVPLKVLPHVVDSVLLAAAIGLLVTLNLNPFATPWLTAKIVALIAYIGVGTVCMKAPPRSARQWVAFVVAMAIFAYIVLVAVTKSAY